MIAESTHERMSVSELEKLRDRMRASIARAQDDLERLERYLMTQTMLVADTPCGSLVRPPDRHAF